MDDYISRQTAIDAIGNIPDYDDGMVFEALSHAIRDIALLTSADVTPVRHGHWETIEGWYGDEIYRCSECKAEFLLIEGTPKDNDYLYCPHCGARMDGEQNG